MKKILILLLIIIVGVTSYGRVVSRPAVRSVSRVRTSSSKPRISSFKASTPSRSNSATFKSTSSNKAKIISVKPISNNISTNTTKKNLSNFTSSQNKTSFSNLSNFENTSKNTVIYRENSNFWNNLFFYNMLFNKNKTTPATNIISKNEKLTSDQELIKALEEKLNRVKLEKTGTIELVRSLEKTIELLKNNLKNTKSNVIM